MKSYVKSATVKDGWDVDDQYTFTSNSVVVAHRVCASVHHVAAFSRVKGGKRQLRREEACARARHLDKLPAEGEWEGCSLQNSAYRCNNSHPETPKGVLR
jgi:hypothetical protein